MLSYAVRWTGQIQERLTRLAELSAVPQVSNAPVTWLKVDGFQSEIGCGCHQVAVAAIDLLQSILDRAGKMESISRSQKHAVRQFHHSMRLSFDKCRRDRERNPQSRPNVRFDLGGKKLKFPKGETFFSKVSVQRSDDFAPTDGTTSNISQGRCHGSNPVRIGFHEVKLCEIAGIEIVHRPSRPSETISALSGPVCGRIKSRATPGTSFRFRKGLPATEGAGGNIRAIGFPC